MEQKVNQAFDALHMEDSCALRIEQAMTQTRRSPVRPVLRAAVAACLTLAILVIALNPTTAKAVEEIAAKLRNYFSRTPGTIILEKDYTYYNDGHLEIDSRPGQASGALTTSGFPSWLKILDDRVYFTGTAETKYFLENKEEFDITGQFSSVDPFTAVFEKDGITYYVAVGGNFSPDDPDGTLEYLEHFRRTDEIETGMYTGWIGGSGSMKYRDAEASLFPIWYAKAVVELDIPWNYSEAKRQLESYEATQ